MINLSACRGASGTGGRTDAGGLAKLNLNDSMSVCQEIILVIRLCFSSIVFNGPLAHAGTVTRDSELAPDSDSDTDDHDSSCYRDGQWLSLGAAFKYYAWSTKLYFNCDRARPATDA